MLAKASRTINRNIGSRPNDVTDATYTADLEDLCIQMVDRMRQIAKGRGKQASIPMFSPNDFLIKRERDDLVEIGVELGFRGGFGAGGGD